MLHVRRLSDFHSTPSSFSKIEIFLKEASEQERASKEIGCNNYFRNRNKGKGFHCAMNCYIGFRHRLLKVTWQLQKMQLLKDKTVVRRILLFQTVLLNTAAVITEYA